LDDHTNINWNVLHAIKSMFKDKVFGSVRSIYWHCAMPTALSSQLAGWALSRQTSMVRRHPR
jgi:hypothetical protein